MNRPLVCVTTPHGRCGIDVDAVLHVLAIGSMDSLPAPRPGVVGLVEIDGAARPVLSVLGSTGNHVVLVAHGDRRFGLLVDRVIGVQAVEADEIGPPPEGQAEDVVGGVAIDGDGLLLVLDVEVLSGRLLE